MVRKRSRKRSGQVMAVAADGWDAVAADGWDAVAADGWDAVAAVGRWDKVVAVGRWDKVAATAAPQPVSAQVVGNSFVEQYYQILHHSPGLVHRFYQDVSKLGRPEDDGTMSITTTITAIKDKIMSLNYDDFGAEIKSVDAQESLSLGVHVLVTGCMTGKDNMKRNFTQSFFLAPQEKGGYFVLNDMFRYTDSVSKTEGENEVLTRDVEDFRKKKKKKKKARDVEAPVDAEQVHAIAAPVQEDHIAEQTNVVTEEANGEQVHIDNEEIEIAEEEEPVDEVPDDSQLVVEANIKIEEMPKKSYASIVAAGESSELLPKDDQKTNTTTTTTSQQPLPGPANDSSATSGINNEGSGSHSRHVSFDLSASANPNKCHLFGHQKPVHSVLGGGKHFIEDADVILWRNKQISASMLASSTVIWLLFEWIGYHILTFVCHSLILTLAALFLWSNLSSFLNKSPPVFPELALPEDLSMEVALLLRDQVNRGFRLFGEVASGRDLKKFLFVILGLWVASIVGSWFHFLTLVYLISVMVLTLPWLYERHEDQVDDYAHKATGVLKKRYNAFDDKVLRKLPKIPLMEDTKQHHSCYVCKSSRKGPIERLVD